MVLAISSTSGEHGGVERRFELAPQAELGERFNRLTGGSLCVIEARVLTTSSPVGISLIVPTQKCLFHNWYMAINTY